MSISIILTHRLTRNVIFWILYAGLPVYMNWGNFGSKANLYTDFLYYGTCAFLGYTNNLVLIPRLFDRGRLRRYFVVATLMVVIVTAIDLFLITPLMSDFLSRQNRPWVTYWYSLGKYFFFVGAFTGAALLDRLARQQKIAADLSELQRETELSFLRSQINPHLLFNTLNMIYSHALEGAQAVPEMIVKLSRTMRYVLYEAGAKEVSLTKEIELIEDFIALQKLRLEERVRVDLRVLGNPLEIRIPPTLLIVYVENAFKHGSQGHTGLIGVDIIINVGQENLDFRVTNTAPAHPPNNYRPVPPGIGLANSRKRLEILYGEKYHLQCGRVNDLYSVDLSIPIA